MSTIEALPPFFPPVVVRALADKIYEKRKMAALEVEKYVQNLKLLKIPWFPFHFTMLGRLLSQRKHATPLMEVCSIGLCSSSPIKWHAEIIWEN
jgi:hypothetical protein